MPQQIEIDEIRQLLAEGAQLVEVLPSAEFEEEHLPGAINIPLKQMTEAAGIYVCIVVNPEGIVQGRLRGRALEETPQATAKQAMEIGPTTIRPSERLEPLVERMHRRGVATIVASDLKGHLVGILYRDDAERALEAARR